jgi:DNA uptake protein ComE-like DNA-binding protein
MWSTSQRAVVLAIVIGIFVYLCIRVSFQHTIIPNPQPIEGSRASELADHLDPNTATQAEFAAIPTIGDKLAGSIVEYRDRYIKEHPGRLAFNEPKDLMHVRGVGQARMETLREYLEFPAVYPR